MVKIKIIIKNKSANAGFKAWRKQVEEGISLKEISKNEYLIIMKDDKVSQKVAHDKKTYLTIMAYNQLLKKSIRGYIRNACHYEVRIDE